MAQLSFPHTSVGGDRVVTAEMARESNKGLGMSGWGYGLACTRNAPSGAEFTVTAGVAYLDGVSYFNSASLTVTGSAYVGTNGIILKFGSDRDCEIIWVQDYANNPPVYAHVLLYLDIQGGTYSLTDNRPNVKVGALHDRPSVVKTTNIENAAVTSAKIGAGEVKQSNIEAGAVTKTKISKNAIISGIYTRTGAFQSGDLYSFPVTFPETFTSVPSVNTTVATVDPTKWAVGVNSVTTTGFNISLVRVGNNLTGSIDIHWTAANLS